MSCCESGGIPGPMQKRAGRRATLKWLVRLAGGVAVAPSRLGHGQGRESRRVRLAFCGQLL